MDGFAVGMVCYRMPDDAAAAVCSSVAGVTSAGVASCDASSVSLDAVAGVLSYTLNVDSAQGRVSRAVSVSLPNCEPVDVVSFAPVLAAFLLAGVVIVSAKMVYTKVFNRETF